MKIADYLKIALVAVLAVFVTKLILSRVSPGLAANL